MVAEEQHATVDRRAGELIVCSYSKTTAGFWVGNRHHKRLPVAVGDDELGAAVVAAPDHSEYNAALPPRDGTPFDPVLRELGLRSFGDYMTGTAQVGISGALDGISVTPKHNGGGKVGFTEIRAAIEFVKRPIGHGNRDSCSAPFEPNHMTTPRSNQLERATVTSPALDFARGRLAARGVGSWARGLVASWASRWAFRRGGRPWRSG